MSDSTALSVNVAEVLNPKLWRERYAYSLPVGATPDERSAARGVFKGIPDEVIRWHLRAALSEAEMHLGVTFGLRVIKSRPLDPGARQGVDYDEVVERLPLNRGEEMQFFRIDLPYGPILSVERIRAYYWDQKVWEFGTEDDQGLLQNVRLEWPRAGTLHIIPVQMQMFLTGVQGAFGVWTTLQSHPGPVPGVWAVDYTVGPTDKGKPGHVPAVLAHWCYCVAGITLLSIGGLAQSKGLSSTSLSFDGISKSVGLQASAIYGINSALETVYDNAVKRIDWKRLRAAYGRGMRVRML